MKINYNVQGKARKALVNAIAEILGEEAKYQGTPSYAYEIGKYTVDRDGTLIGRKNDSLAVKLAEHGFISEEESLAEIPAETTPESETQADGVETAEGENGADTGETSEESEDGIFTISYPLGGFTPVTLDNLQKMVDSKAPLIKKAIGAEQLPIQIDEEKVNFPWFEMPIGHAEMMGYGRFIERLCKTAQAKQRVTATAPNEFENEKFSMRVWMISLGMKGSEYALSRKLLMAKLDGNTAFRYEDKQPRNSRSGERVQKEVVSVRFTPETLGKLAELASQNNMSRNQLIESVVCEYVQAEFPTEDETVDTTDSAPESEVQGDE